MKSPFHRNPPEKWKVTCQFCEWNSKAFYQSDLAQWLIEHYRVTHEIRLTEERAVKLITPIELEAA